MATLQVTGDQLGRGACSRIHIGTVVPAAALKPGAESPVGVGPPSGDAAAETGTSDRGAVSMLRRRSRSGSSEDHGRDSPASGSRTARVLSSDAGDGALLALPTPLVDGNETEGESDDLHSDVGCGDSPPSRSWR